MRRIILVSLLALLSSKAIKLSKEEEDEEDPDELNKKKGNVYDRYKPFEIKYDSNAAA